MTNLSEAALWECADIAYAMEGFATLRSSATHDEARADEWGHTRQENEFESLRCRTVRLPDGDIHVCTPEDCAFGEPGVDGTGARTGDIVCRLTGLVLYRICEQRTDFSTGRSTFSADPDVTCGPAQGGVWKRKRDAVRDSQAAFDAATSISNTEMPKTQPRSKEVRACVVKRGALCVDEVDVEPACPKRARISKRDVGSSNTLALLVQEAKTTFVKLLGKRGNEEQPSSSKPIDARLLDRELLFKASLKRYLKDQKSSGRPILLDEIHNLSLAVEGVIATEKLKLLNIETSRTSRVHRLDFKSIVARLAVAIWTGAMGSPYMQAPRRASESFRPFAAGIFYALKRGLTLRDGSILVPKIDEWTSALPTQKQIASDASCKSLHSSCHRGLCVVHRAIASCELPLAHALFAEAIALAKCL